MRLPLAAPPLLLLVLLPLLPAPARGMHPQPPAWVSRSARLRGGAPGAACHGALDCNARECASCGCADGRCKCGGGYSGPHCEQAFCTNRTHGCSGHGSCMQTLYNNTCICDKYYSGAHCEIAQCQLDCKHGSAPNKGCTACEGCKGAWSGKLCDTWDKSVPIATLMAKLAHIKNASQNMLNAQAPFKPVCKQGHECVGWGVDGVTGKPTAFPIVYLSCELLFWLYTFVLCIVLLYSAVLCFFFSSLSLSLSLSRCVSVSLTTLYPIIPRLPTTTLCADDPGRTDKKYNGLSEPLEVQSNHVVNPVWASVDGTTMTYARVNEFVAHVNSQYGGATPAPKGTSGIYSRDFASVFNEYFQRADDRALTVSRASQSLIQMKLPVDPATNARAYHLDRHAADFLYSLPATYASADDKKQFREFIDNYGTSFAISATLGGRVEQYALWKTWLTDSRLGAFTAASLSRNAQVDFYGTTGLPGSAGGGHDGGYSAGTSVQPLHCEGGDPKVSCQSSFAKWADTLKGSPILLDYELAPISDLVDDPATKKALDLAVQDYVKEQTAAWSAVNKCPHSCGGVGSCGGGGGACSCSRPGRVGRMCSGCAPVSVRGTFRDIKGKEHSGVATVACDGRFVTAWSGSAACQTQSGGDVAVCPNGGAATAFCARTSDGSLQAKVEQKKCQVKFPKGDDFHPKTYCGAFSASSGGASASAKEVDGARKNPPCATGMHNDKCEVNSKCEYA